MLSTNLPWSLANTKWASEINPILNCPLVSGRQISAIQFVANTPQVINHQLGRVMQGYFPVYMGGPARMWVTQPFNNLTLTLETDANVLVSLWVY